MQDAFLLNHFQSQQPIWDAQELTEISLDDFSDDFKVEMKNRQSKHHSLDIETPEIFSGL